MNVSQVREIEHDGRLITTGIFKSPVPGRVRVRAVNLDGDAQADLTVHGGPDKAVYAYGLQDLRYWASVQGRAVGAGSMGENLTTTGMNLAEAVVGERWRVGTVLLEVSSPRIPCYKLAIRMEDPTFVRKFALARRPGAYLRVVAEGELAAGDPIDLVERPGHGVTVGAVVDAYFGGDHRQAARLLEAPQLAMRWTTWARELLAG